MFEGSSYEQSKSMIPQVGTSLTLAKKGFLVKSFKPVLPGLEKYINLVKINKAN